MDFLRELTAKNIQNKLTHAKYIRGTEGIEKMQEFCMYELNNLYDNILNNNDATKK